ncbi:MAG TPA: glutaminyl-peptide cyclotransferase [Vicinamibacterales bacterium]|nr:glutaminyl-peptide cyclotransferase [Vicinamibacterales bacterium]
MNRASILRAAAVATLCTLAVMTVTANNDQAGAARPAPVQTFTVVQSYPHDPGAFTQGLVFANGEFYESTGLNGESSVRRVEIASGKVLQSRPVDKQYFAEGLALVGDALVQLTWQHKLGFVYDRKTMAPRKTFAYKTEGWGLAYDVKGGLVLSDGSDTLFFLDPKTYRVVRTVRVTDAGRPVPQLNELEWIEGEIWANVWQTDRIARVNPRTGAVNAWVDLTLLWPQARRSPPADVLNGIAYDPAGKRIFVTGKKWPRVYEIKIQ